MAELQIPGKCRQVYEVLQGRHGTTPFVQSTGKWRYIDIIHVAGRNSAERKLRELRVWAGIQGINLILADNYKGKDGTIYKVFWVNPSAIATAPKAHSGELFPRPMRGRPE